MIDWLALSLTFKTGPRSALPSLALARVYSSAALHHEDIISNLSPAFDSIPELCTSSGPWILTKVVLIAKLTSSVKLGHYCQTLLSLLDLYLGTDCYIP